MTNKEGRLYQVGFFYSDGREEIPTRAEIDDVCARLGWELMEQVEPDVPHEDNYGGFLVYFTEEDHQSMEHDGIVEHELNGISAVAEMP